MGKTTEEQGNETIKMVDRALQVLDLLRSSKNSIGVNAIAKECGMNPSTAFRIIKTLEKNGWAFQCSNDQYIAGEKLSFMLGKENFYIALKETALLVMEKYTARYNQAMNLIVRESYHCYVLQQSRTKSLVDYVSPLYSDLPFYACAGGKVLLSELPESFASDIISSSELRPLTPHTITDPELFRKELQKVADQGYAYDDRESALNGSCIAVPVRNSDGKVIAALSFSGFVGVADIKQLDKYIEPLKEASQEISKKLFRDWQY